MKILQFGGSGQLGCEIQKRAEDLDFSLVSPVLSDVDITSRQQVLHIVERIKPDLIINCAAYTAVDKAESEQELAFSINREGARYVAEATKKIKAFLIHVSTDYVFAGDGNKPLTENDPTNPLSIYGSSKLAGEQAVLEVLDRDALVVRTSSLHGQYGINFVHTMLSLFEERDEVRVVDDQIMSPTWAGWLAEVLIDLGKIKPGGIIHACCAGQISWFDFAAEILRLAVNKEGAQFTIQLEAMKVAELVRAAQRPKYSVMDTSKLTSLLGREPIPWQEGLRHHLIDLGQLNPEYGV